MKCEHAQDFFSEYIEQTLDKPAAVALEAHLTACASCRRGVEGLQQTWGALNAVPAVEPPGDLAWRVMVQLQQERLERLEAERRRPNRWLGWLQTLTPGAAFGYAVLVAVLFIGIAFPLRGHLPQISFDIFGIGQSAPAVVQIPPELQPLMDLGPAQRDPQTGRLSFYPLVITTATGLGASNVTVTPLVQENGEWREGDGIRHTVAAGQSQMVPVPTAVGMAPVLAVRVHVVSLDGHTFDKELSVASP